MGIGESNPITVQIDIGKGDAHPVIVIKPDADIVGNSVASVGSNEYVRIDHMSDLNENFGPGPELNPGLIEIGNIDTMQSITNVIESGRAVRSCQTPLHPGQPHVGTFDGIILVVINENLHIIRPLTSLGIDESLHIDEIFEVDHKFGGTAVLLPVHIVVVEDIQYINARIKIIDVEITLSIRGTNPITVQIDIGIGDAHPIVVVYPYFDVVWNPVGSIGPHEYVCIYNVPHIDHKFDPCPVPIPGFIYERYSGFPQIIPEIVKGDRTIDSGFAPLTSSKNISTLKRISIIIIYVNPNVIRFHASGSREYEGFSIDVITGIDHKLVTAPVFLP